MALAPQERAGVSSASAGSRRLEYCSIAPASGIVGRRWKKRALNWPPTLSWT